MRKYFYLQKVSDSGKDCIARYELHKNAVTITGFHVIDGRLIMHSSTTTELNVARESWINFRREGYSRGHHKL